MRIGLVAGEASGDLLGAGLIEALRQHVPDIQCEGVAGTAMQMAGCNAFGESDALAVMGLIEPIRHIPRLLRLRRNLVRHWTANPPDVFVGIDAPDFNLGLEKQLKDLGVPTVHYVSPSVWAWRQRRVHKIGRATNNVLCVLPFEPDFYAQHGIAATFVGHPLADRLPRETDAKAVRQELGIRATRVVTIMPGSRMSEVTRLGPVFLQACQRLLARYDDIAFVTPMASEATRAMFTEQLTAMGLNAHFTLLDQGSESAIIAGDVVLLASGTAALESALLCRPTIAAYRLAPLSYFLAKVLRLVKVKYFTLPNHLTDEPLVPEFLQGGATPQALGDAVSSLLDNDAERVRIQQVFAGLRDQLACGASEQAAEAVLTLAKQSAATA
ncbi:lipid-A-disaccharide synthase [Woeseia oceani]|uniref:lipid-A-disaccharide synthase n=1 Tax=Woeseia oceani TaxID=1548547 RepID=UPI000A493683|nr:lipid-A-disaccharide synthase [Woeseia oceani]